MPVVGSNGDSKLALNKPIISLPKVDSNRKDAGSEMKLTEREHVRWRLEWIKNTFCATGKKTNHRWGDWQGN